MDNPTSEGATGAGASAFDTPPQQDSAQLRSLLAAIVSTSDDAIVSKGLDGVIRSWNRGAERLFGYSAAEAVGRPIDLIIPPELRHEEESILQRIGRGEPIEHFETVRVAKDGRRLDISLAISPIRDASGRVVGASKVARDITERKRAEQALRASEERFRAIVDSQSEMICRFRSDGTILFVNRAYAQALDTTPEALVQRNFWEFVSREDRAGVRAMLDGLTPGTPEVRIENRFEAAAGVRWTLWTNRALSFDEHGRVHEAQSAGIDITDRKRAEQALLEADRRKNEFLATLGHELRNPLAPLRSMLDILTHGNLDSDSTRNAREMMARQLDVLVRLVDDLLDVSRITQGKLQLRKERVDMAALVANAVGDIRESVAAAGQEVVVIQPDEPVAIVADPVRIGQVLTNLLSNAAKFTPEGGRIELVIEPGTDEVRISVRDDGLGIPPDKLDYIFEMFSQVDSPLANGRKGLGIGLSLVRWLVDLHDGRVEAASAGPGRGSEFSVWLPRGPVCETALETPREDTGPVVSDGSCRRVLIVDDSLDAASSLAMLVEFLGHEVRLAADGVEAVEVASEFRPELVLLDIGLPGLSGYDVARRIRDQEWGRDAVLAAVTGWGQEADRQLALEAGCDLHTTKPLTLKTLRAVLETVAQRAPAERGPR